MFVYNFQAKLDTSVSECAGRSWGMVCRCGRVCTFFFFLGFGASSAAGASAFFSAAGGASAFFSAAGAGAPSAGGAAWSGCKCCLYLSMCACVFVLGVCVCVPVEHKAGCTFHHVKPGEETSYPNLCV